MGPAGQKKFGFSGTIKPKSLKKSRAARAKETTISDHHHHASLIAISVRPLIEFEKNEDPAKMTHPIPDFLSGTRPVETLRTCPCDAVEA